MIARLAALIVAVAVTSSAAGCSSSHATSLVVLDGRPRPPDQEGVVEKVSFTSLTLDGGRTYKITRRLQCFSTQTMQAVPLLDRKGQYVHLGVDGHTVVWLAAVGAILRTPSPVVFYTGTLVRRSGRTVTFRDGTVLRLAAGVEPPVAKGFLQVQIDPARHLVTSMRLP